MSFKIAKEPQFTHRVTVRVPCDGGYEDQSLNVRFRVLPTAEQEKLKASDDLVTAFLRRAVVSMEDIVDDTVKELPFSDQLRDQMLDLPFVRFALARAYGEAVVGEQVKNSAGRVAPG